MRPLFVLLLMLAGHAAGPVHANEKQAQLCQLCHRVERGMPLLESQPADYLVAQVEAYRAGKRNDPAMNPNVARLTAREIRDIAVYFAKQPLPTNRPAPDAAQAQAGAAVAESRSCARCHQAGFVGVGVTPRLAGQLAFYTAQQLDAFAAKRRMHPAPEVAALTATEREQLAQYYASLGR